MHEKYRLYRQDIPDEGHRVETIVSHCLTLKNLPIAKISKLELVSCAKPITKEEDSIKGLESTHFNYHFVLIIRPNVINQYNVAY